MSQPNRYSPRSSKQHGPHRLAAVLLLAGLMHGSPAAAKGNDDAAAGPAPPPNVVMLISDDQAWNDYGFMGHPHIATPRLDLLAAESLVFTRGYVPSSLCRASLATMITGLHPHRHAITSNDPPSGLPAEEKARQNEEMDRLITRVPTLPRLLGSQAGYLSLQTGKWWEGTPANGGFTDGMTHGVPARGGRHGDAGLDIGRQGIAPIREFIARATREGKPFFVWYAPFLPHAPHTPPKELEEKYLPLAESPAVARYWAMCEWFDRTCGEVLDAVEEHGLADNTVVVYVCDNGWIQDPERPNRYAPRSKRSQYDGGLRTPIMVRWPGRVTPRFDRITPVSSTDLAPTILAACGIKPESRLPGTDLLDAEALARRERIFGDIYLHDAVDIERPLASLNFRWVVEGAWKLIVPHPPNAPGETVELFNVLDDPLESRNLAASEPERTDRLRREIDAWLPVPES